MLRILLVADVFFYYLAPIANALAEECRVLVLTRDSGYEFGLGEADGVHFKRQLLDSRVGLAVVRGRQSDLSSLVSTFCAGRVVRHFSPDIVHSQDHADWRLYAVGRLASRRANRVVTVHDVVPHLGERRSANALQKRVSRCLRNHADTIVVHGEVLRKQALCQPWYAGQTVMSVPHGLLAHPSVVTALPDSPRVLFFGRAEFYKGLDIFIRSVELAASSVPELRAVIAARGPEVARCRALVRRPDLFDWRESFVRDDALPALFAEVCAVVAPYREASQSGVVPLAFANGRPVVVSPVGSLAECVETGVNGVVAATATAESLAAAIVRVVSDRGQLETMSKGAASTVIAGDLSAAHIAALHMKVYEQLTPARVE